MPQGRRHPRAFSLVGGREFRDGRRAPRVVVRGQAESRIRPTVEVTLIDLSLTGAGVEHQTLLRPGARCELAVGTDRRELRPQAKVLRSVVHRWAKQKGGQIEFIYRSGV